MIYLLEQFGGTERNIQIQKIVINQFRFELFISFKTNKKVKLTNNMKFYQCKQHASGWG